MEKCTLQVLSVFLCFLLSSPVVSSYDYNDDDMKRQKGSTRLDIQTDHTSNLEKSLRSTIQLSNAIQAQLYEKLRVRIFLLIQKMSILEKMISAYRRRIATSDKIVFAHSTHSRDVRDAQANTDKNDEPGNHPNQKILQAQNPIARALEGQKETLESLNELLREARETKFELVNFISCYLTATSKAFSHTAKESLVSKKSSLGTEVD